MKNFYVLFLCLLQPCLSIAQTQLTNLPTMYINTNDGSAVTDKETYIPATITIVSSNRSDNMTNVSCSVKGHGNSTWGMPKKPYHLKLDKKTNMFGLPANAKSWILLANYADKTLIHDALASKISELAGMSFSPSRQFVDLYFNGQYEGNYMFSDLMEEGPQRVALEELTMADMQEPEVSGGYLLQLYGFASSDPVWFTSSQGMPIIIKYPGSADINDQQKNYIINYINNTFESRLFSDNFKDPVNGYRAVVDSVSLVNWYIASELTGNPDSFWSIYIYKHRNDDRLYFGPLWDFDIAFNNDNRLGDATYKLMRDYAHEPRAWIERIWQDEWFKQAVQRRWTELVNSGIEDTLETFIDQTAALIDQSQQKNYQVWNTLNTRVYLETYLFDTYAEGIDYLKTYMKERIDFLNKNLISPAPTPPFTVENYYYTIQNNNTNNAIDVTGGSALSGALLMLWQPLYDTYDNDSQLWKIEPVDNTYFRFINKHSGLAMTANGINNNLLQKPLNTEDAAQKWKITPILTGDLYGIESAVAPDYYAVDNNGGIIDNGNKVIVWNNQITSNTNQQWHLLKQEVVGGSSGIIQNTKTPFEYYVSGNQLCVNNLPQNALLRVFDLQGIRIREVRTEGELTSISLPQKGIYILNVITEGGTCSVKIKY